MVAFRLNGQEISAETDPHLPLLHFLREQGLTGTKEGCAEGECGACAVLLVRRGPDGQTRYVPMNACLVLTSAVHGEELLTVEGLAPSEDALHPVQAAMVERGGSQCGYCTPGFIVSMFAEYYRRDREEGAPDFESIGGNLCRCTGYRPIRDALVSLRVPSAEDPARTRLDAAPPAPAAASETHGELRFDRPTTLDALFAILAEHPDAKIVAGGTDVVVEINQMDRRFGHVVAIDAIDALRGLEDEDDALVIGAGEPLAFVEETLHGQLPMFDELFPLFSSRLIRNRATFGGNLVNASPIGDGPPALLALDAALVLASAEGERTVPLADFFTGYRATVLRPGEIVKAVRVPKPLPDLQRFYKVSKRIMDDISTVAAGFGIWLDGAGVVTKARLAYGGVAATPVRATDAEAALVGKPLSEVTLAEAARQASSAFAPITDHRGSARYRKAMIGKLLEKLAAEQFAQAAE